MVIAFRFVPVPYTPLMLWRTTSTILDKETIGIEKKWMPISKISKSIQKAVIRAEDEKFYDHNGFDFEAIEKARAYNRTHKKTRGASTISQQTAKNVFLWPSRSWVRKGLEVYFTILIEFFWNKERILEVYLNVIEFGKGVYGVEAAANKFFKTSALKISNSQAALMAAVLPNPIKFKISRPSRYVLRRQSKILARINYRTRKKEEARASDIKQHDSTNFFELKFDSDDEVDKKEIDTNVASSGDEKNIQSMNEE